MAMSGVIGSAGRGLTSVPSEFGGNTESVFVPCCVEEVPAWLRAVFSVAVTFGTANGSGSALKWSRKVELCKILGSAHHCKCTGTTLYCIVAFC